VILLKAIRKSLDEVDMKGAPHKMIPNVAKALLHISRGGNLDYNYVSSHYGYTKRSATKFIIALQRRGLLERRGGRQLFLTEKGRKHLPG
jgi:Mn-dependent DtxR family transcriptional regulator